MQLHPVDLTILAAWFGLMLALGVWFSRTNTSTGQYFLGGRNFSGWTIGLSLVGTSISSITFLAYPGDAFKTNWLRFLPNLALPLAVVIAAFLFLPRLRRADSITAYEFLERRFGPTIRGYAAIAFLLAQVARISMILYLLALVIQTVAGIDAHYSVLIAGLFVAAYTVLGGIEAVVWTDVIQTVVLIFGGLFCIGTVLSLTPGGLPYIIETAWSAGKLGVGDYTGSGFAEADWSLALTRKTATMMLLIGLINWLTE